MQDSDNTGIATLAVRRPTLIVSIVVLIIVAGCICFRNLGLEQFPDISFPTISIMTTYPGVGPQEMETLVSRPIEDQVSAIAGLKHVSSESQYGVSSVTAEFEQGTDVKYAEQKVKDKVGLVRPSLPKDTDEPLVRAFDPADQSIYQLALSASLSPKELYDLADNEIRPRLEQVANVSAVTITGGTKREISVHLDRNDLVKRGLSVAGVAKAIGENSSNISLGELTTGDKRVLFRTVGEYRTLDRIRNVPIKFFNSDVPVTVGDLGSVVDGSAETTSLSFYNGKQAIIIDIYRQSGSNTVSVSDLLGDRVKNINESLHGRPGDPKLIVVKDNARFVRMDVYSVFETISIAIILTILIVYLFLGSARSTIVTIVALPNSLLGTFILMSLMGYSINVITLLALTMAVGLLVDDAIVVRENIWRKVEEGLPPKKAAIFGTNEVMLAVIATSLTVISVFIPFGFLQGTVGQFLKQLGFTVVFAMSISLFDALTMAPLLSAYLFKAKKNNNTPKLRNGKLRFRTIWERIFGIAVWPFRKATMLFQKMMRELVFRYEQVIRLCLNHRGLVIATSILVFIACLAVVGPKLTMTFAPSSDMGMYAISFEGQPGISLGKMLVDVRQVEKIVLSHHENMKVSVQVGNSQGAANVASMYVEMVPFEKRKITTSQMKDILRKELTKYSGINPIIGEAMGMSGSSPFAINIVGNDMESLLETADKVKIALSKIVGLVDLKLNCTAGKPEFQIIMDSARSKVLGVSTDYAGAELRNMIDGSVAAKFREAGNEYDVRVRLQDGQRNVQEEFDSFYVPNINSTLVRLADISTPNYTKGPTKIFRRDRSRYVQISGGLAAGVALGSVQEGAQRTMDGLKLPKNVRYEFVGQSEQMRDMVSSILYGIGLGMILMYLILASLYESAIIPLLIMTALPFAVSGALLALYIFGESISMFTLISIVLLLGLVAKNSILLVDLTQQLMRRGLSCKEALVKAGITRLRPILMTTFALIAGMLPLALGLSEAGRMRRGMGIAIIGGLASSTILTLLIIPASFELINSFRIWVRSLMGRSEPREIDVPTL